MLCYACGEPAVSQCQNCGLFYCANHGRVYCVGCKPLEQVAPAALKAEAADRTGANRGQLAKPAPPRGRCYGCGTPSDRVCRLCGGFFCGEHRGWRDVRIGRYAMRQIVCGRCAGEGPWPSPQVKWLLGGALILLAVAVYLLMTLW